MTFTRVVVVGFMVGATALLAPPHQNTVAAVDPVDLLLLGVGIGVLVLSIVYAIVLRLAATERSLAALAYVQLTGDAALAGTLVFLTGGTTSSFTLIFSLTILVAAVVVYRSGAFFQATACTVFLLLIGFGEASGVTEKGPVAATRASGSQVMAPLDQEEAAAQVGSLIYRLMNNVLAFYAIAFLGSQLSEALRRTDIQLEEKSESLDRLRAVHDDIVGSIPSGLMTVDRAGVIAYFNDTARLIVGEDLTGRGIDQLVKRFPLLAGAFGEAARAPGQRILVAPGVQGDAARVVEWQISPLRDQNQAPIGHLVLCQDVTNLREMEGQVRRAERFASIGRLAASIAHEIRNPLTSISGSIQLLEQSGDAAPDDKRLMAIVRRETDALNRWITDFLTYAGPRRAEPVPLDLAAVLRDTVAVLKHDAKSSNIQVDLQVAPDAEGPLVHADPTYFRQVVWNVLSNGVQAMPEGGNLRVSLARRPGGPHQLRLVVTDDGDGIDPTVRDRIFDPFVTTKPTGSGLGLATAFRVVSEHGGRIHFDSTAGEGTSFYIDLPLAAAPAPETGDGAEEAVA